MASIRSYKEFKLTQVDGSVSINEGFSNKWVPGICITLDDKSIVSKTTVRRICGCGHVFDGSDTEKCPMCQNDKWIFIHIGGRYYYRGRWGNDGHCYCNDPELIDGRLVTPVISASWDKASNRFNIVEQYYDLVSISTDGFLSINSIHGLDANQLDVLFEQWIENNPAWDAVKLMENIYPCEEICKKLDIEERKIATMFTLYNIMQSIPNLTTLSPDMFYAVFDRYRTACNRRYKSLTDFYKDLKIPIAFSDIYAMTGLPNEDLSKVDKLDPVVIHAMSYSLTHCHTTYRDIASIVRTDEHVYKINDKPAEFAEFFRKNVIKFAGNTLEAFEYVDGNSTIKDANIKKFINYCGKKNIKRDKIEKFYNNMYDGNAIKALESLL